MFFRQILHEEKSCLSYMIGCPTKGTCAVIDAQGDPEQYIDIAQNHGLIITHVIETHIQADHLSASPHLELSKHDFIDYLFEDMPKPPPNFEQIKEKNTSSK